MTDLFENKGVRAWGFTRAVLYHMMALSQLVNEIQCNPMTCNAMRDDGDHDDGDER